jgi:hypothetical protein
VFVAGRQVIDQGRHAQQTEIAAQFAQAMDNLWNP